MGLQLNSELWDLRPGRTEASEGGYAPSTRPSPVESCVIYLVASPSFSHALSLFWFCPLPSSRHVPSFSALPSLLLLFSVIARAVIWLEDRRTDQQARRGEARLTWLWRGAWMAAWVGGRAVRKWADPAGRCSGITASPGWGSRCKALIAPRSPSSLCGRPLRSCPPPPRLQRGRASGERQGLSTVTKMSQGNSRFQTS